MKYSIHDAATVPVRSQLYVAFIAAPGAPRGEYAEEVDILVEGRGQTNLAEVRRTAQKYVDETLVEGCKIRRIQKVW